MRQLGLGGGAYPERPDEADCIYYLRTGFCGYGARCRFNHPRDRSLVILRNHHCFVQACDMLGFIWVFLMNFLGDQFNVSLILTTLICCGLNVDLSHLTPIPHKIVIFGNSSKFPLLCSKFVYVRV